MKKEREINKKEKSERGLMKKRVRQTKSGKSEGTNEMMKREGEKQKGKKIEGMNRKG